MTMELRPVDQAFLEAFVERHRGVAGSVHVRRGDTLYMTAAHRLPPPVIAVTEVVPNGKGMAGLALQGDRAIQTCNLQTDTSGSVKPGAKAVNAQAAVAIPVHGPAGVRAVVGIAWAEERELTAAEIGALSADAEHLPG